MIESKFVADRGRALIAGCLHDTESELAPPVSGSWLLYCRLF